MTFPSAPFPRTSFDGTPCTRMPPIGGGRMPHGEWPCKRCGLSECARPLWTWPDREPRDFPILRASPLWRQTWVWNQCTWHRRFHGDDVQVAIGRWFPPLDCRKNGERKIFLLPVGSGARNLWRLYSVDNCADCTAALQAVELMVYGIAWEMQQWPDAWEHRCWFGGLDVGNLMMHDCTCGAGDSLTNLYAWRWLADLVVSEWAVDNRTSTTTSLADLLNSELIGQLVQHFDDPDAPALFTSLTNTVGTTGADLTVENLLEARRLLIERSASVYGMSADQLNPPSDAAHAASYALSRVIDKG